MEELKSGSRYKNDQGKLLRSDKNDDSDSYRECVATEVS